MSRKSGFIVEERVPECPTFLVPPPQEFHADSNDEVLSNLLMAGRAVAFGGVSLAGDKGWIVRSIGIYRMVNIETQEGADLKGWSLFLGRGSFEKPTRLLYLDTTRNLNLVAAFPNCGTYFVGEVTDTSLIETTADRKQLQAIIRFIIPFISDDGPPPELGAAWEALATVSQTSDKENIELMLKQTEYLVKNHPAHVAYLVLDNKIYFTGIEPDATTINWAEAIVRAICEAEGINWQEYSFYDIQTYAGGYHRDDPSYYSIDELKFYSDTLAVSAWHPVTCRMFGSVASRWPDRPGVEEEVLTAFQRFIG